MPAERKKELHNELFGASGGYGQDDEGSVKDEAGYAGKKEGEAGSGYEEKKEEASSRASYAAYEDKKEPLPYYEPGAPSPSGAYYEPGAPSPSGAYYEPGAPSPSGAYDYQHQTEAQIRREARGAQLNWITASEEMVPDSGRADQGREVQQAPSPSGA